MKISFEILIDFDEYAFLEREWGKTVKLFSKLPVIGDKIKDKIKQEIKYKITESFVKKLGAYVEINEINKNFYIH